MKFNDKEMSDYGARAEAEIEGRLGYHKQCPSEWLPSMASKDRWFKLKHNMLFYYRIPTTNTIDFARPLGLFLLEQFSVMKDDTGDQPFAFAIVFASEPKKRHVFACRCDNDLTRWLSKLKTASAQYWRTQLHIMIAKLNIMREAKNLGRFHVHAPQSRDSLARAFGHVRMIDGDDGDAHGGLIDFK